jgi:hypothetical protein
MSAQQPFVGFLASVGVKLEAPGQRVFWSVACDGVQPRDLRGAEQAAANSMFGPVSDIPPDVRHTVAALKGARVGFSYIGSLRLLHLALTVDLSTMAAGEHAAGIIVAPDLRLARQAFRFLLGAAKGTQAIAGRIVSETTDSLVLRRTDGRLVELVCLPATSGGRATRGRTLVGALLDEASFFRDDTFAVNDAEVYKGIAPRIVPGGQCLIGSTPWVEGVGLLATLYAANRGNPTTALAAHLPTRLMRTSKAILGIVDREYQRDPENAAREYGGRFLDGSTSTFFDPATLALAIDESLTMPAPRIAGATITAAGDFGFSRNSSTLALVQSLTGVCTLSELLEIKPGKGMPLKPSAVGAEFRDKLQSWGCGAFTADAHYRESMRELLAPVQFRDAPAGQQGKAQAHVAARDLMREGKVRLPNNARLLRQLREILSKPLPGGGISISAPQWKSGEHGDLASAFILALWAADGSKSTRAAPYTSDPTLAGCGYATDGMQHLRGGLIDMTDDRDSWPEWCMD